MQIVKLRDDYANLLPGLEPKHKNIFPTDRISSIVIILIYISYLIRYGANFDWNSFGLCYFPDRWVFSKSISMTNPRRI